MSANGRPPSIFLRKEGAYRLSGKNLGILASSVLKHDVPIRMMARGFSMYPLIRDRDVITIHPPAECGPLIGEVAAFIFPGSEKLIVHRIIGKSGSNYLFKGDNVATPDGYIPSEDILGIVTRVERKGKNVSFNPTSQCRFFPGLLDLKIRRFMTKLVGILKLKITGSEDIAS